MIIIIYKQPVLLISVEFVRYLTIALLYLLQIPHRQTHSSVSLVALELGPI